MHLLDSVWRHIVYKLILSDGLNLTEHQSKKFQAFFVIVWKMNFTFFGMSIISIFMQRIYKKYFWNRPNIAKFIELKYL